MILSIIIPVQNAAPYLRRCMDTLLAADLPEREMILSLGNSSDRSEKICREYLEKYSFIRAIRQEGSGLSNARNCALRQARGEYILFVDSDDFVDSGVLRRLADGLLDRTLAADVIVTDFYRVLYPGGKRLKIFQIGENTPIQRGMDFFPEMLKRRQCFWNVWRFLYRREFLEAHQIRFVENKLSEDVDFTTSVFMADPEILFSHSPYYYYNVGRGASLMDQPTLKRLTDTVEILMDCIERLRASGFRYAPEMIAQLQFEYILTLAMAVEVDAASRAEAITRFSSWRDVLFASKDPLVKACCGMLSIVGTENMARLLHELKYLRRRITRRAKTGAKKP